MSNSTMKFSAKTLARLAKDHDAIRVANIIGLVSSHNVYLLDPSNPRPKFVYIEVTESGNAEALKSEWKTDRECLVFTSSLAANLYAVRQAENEIAENNDGKMISVIDVKYRSESAKPEAPKPEPKKKSTAAKSKAASKSKVKDAAVPTLTEDSKVRYTGERVQGVVVKMLARSARVEYRDGQVYTLPIKDLQVVA